MSSVQSAALSGRRPLLLGAPGPLMVPLPRGGPGARELVVGLESPTSTGIAEWRFHPANAASAGQLLLSPRFLDQAFLILDQAGSPPTASDFHISQLPGLDEPLELALGWSEAASPPERYELRWESQQARARAIREWARQHVHPAEWFYVEITTSCNLKCPFCPSKDLNRPRSHMPLDTARTVFRRIGDYVAERDSASNGYVAVNKMVFLHVMGEPLLHPRLVDIAATAREAGLVPAVFTNVTLLDEQGIQRLLDSNLGHVTLSLNAATDDDFASLGGRDTQRHQERRIMGFLRARADRRGATPHVDIQYMFKRDDSVAGPGLLSSKQEVWALYRHWLRVIREPEPPLSHSVNVRPHIDPRPLMKPYAESGEDPSVRLPLSPDISLVVKTACSFGNVALGPGYDVTPIGRGRCPYHNPFRQMAVFVDGTVSFCNLDYENTVNLGSLVDTSVHELWTSPRMQRVRDAMSRGHLTEPVCQRCLGEVRPASEDRSTVLETRIKPPSPSSHFVFE